MFRQVLYTQFKWTRALLALVSVFAFAVPAFCWYFGAQVTWRDATAMQVLAGFSAVGPSLAVLAIASGFLMVAYIWSIDAAARHVYPLSLPIPWPRYVAFRFAAGAIALLLPAVALLLGALFVLALVELPPTLRAYPVSLTVRFYFATLVSYALTFLLQYLTGRRAVITLLLAVLSVVAVALLAAVLDAGPLLGRAARILFEWPGPLAVFTADWALVDV